MGSSKHIRDFLCGFSDHRELVEDSRLGFRILRKPRKIEAIHKTIYQRRRPVDVLQTMRFMPLRHKLVEQWREFALSSNH